ncbi:MAG: P-loop NTPase [Deltaproteobacteria bacterium]|nr:P-loop NTPase [Deltaproteobacteria bacterium]
MNRTITITSGKVGTGKTNICLNLALLLSKLGYRICVFDADMGLPNINTFLGLQPVYNLKDAILDGLNLKDLIIKDYEGIDIFPGSSGVEDMTNIEVDRMRLIRSFSETAHHDFLLHYDFLLVDTPAGISKTVISFCLASSEIIVVITPEHTSLTEAYTLLKTLSLNGFKGGIWVVVNQCTTSHIAKLVYKRFKSIVAKNLRIDIMPLGLIYQDSEIDQAVKQQKIFVSLYPKANASKCLQKIAEHLVAKGTDHLQGFDVVKFWRGCIELISSPLSIKEHVSAREEFSRRKQEPEAITEQSPQKDVSDSPLDPLSLSEATLKESNSKGTITAQQNGEEIPVTSPSESGRSGGWYRHKDAAKHWYRGPLVEPGSGQEIADLEENSLPVIEKLIKNISSISEELQLIRKALEGSGKIMLRVGISGEPDSKKSVTKNNPS